MSSPDPTPEASTGTVKDVEAVELTLEERLTRANEEVAVVCNKYQVTITTQTVPVIVPGQPRSATNLKE